jgi:hypothetical protein
MSQDGLYHTPCWPQWIERKFIQRTLAVWDESGLICTEPADGARIFMIDSYQEYQEVCLRENLAVFTDDVATFPYLQEMMVPKAVPCTSLGTPTSAKFKGPRNTTRWLYSVRSWGNYEDEETGEKIPYRANLDFLARRRMECNLTKCGTYGSPGSQGQALWRKVWKEHGKRKHYAPNSGCVSFIREKANVGGRADMPGMRQEPYADIIELDRVRGYPSEFGGLPTSTAERLYARGSDIHSSHFAGLREWVADVAVTIKKALKWALFQVIDALGNVLKPTEPGEYKTTLWKCEAEQCERHGCEVKVYNGYGWHRTTDDHIAVVHTYEELLEQCPDKIKGMFKTSFLAGMGRFGMGNEHHTLVRAEFATEDDVPLCSDSGPMLDAFLHKEFDVKAPQMIHWFACICARMRVALLEQTIEAEEAGVKILYVNFDAVGAEPHPYFSRFPEKSSTLPTGSWGRTTWNDVELKVNRHFKGKRKRDGKLRDDHPGIPRARSA